MANHPQAAKRNRQRIKIQARARHQRSTMRTYIKRVRTAVAERSAEVASAALKVAVPMIARCGQKGVIPPTRASRLISRLSTAVNRLSE